jgi:hypothetical protein
LRVRRARGELRINGEKDKLDRSPRFAWGVGGGPSVPDSSSKSSAAADSGRGGRKKRGERSGSAGGRGDEEPSIHKGIAPVQ